MNWNFLSCVKFKYKSFTVPFYSILIILIILWGFTSPVNGASQETANKKQVLFLPFVVDIPDASSGYLENGLSSVLASRLAIHAGIRPIGGNGTGKKLFNHLQQGRFDSVKKMLAAAKADYLVIGALEQEEKNYLISCYVFTGASVTSPAHFEKQFPHIDDIIKDVDDMAWEISDKIFGKPRPVKSKKNIDKSNGVAAFHTTHPDRLYKEEKVGMAELGIGDRFELITVMESPKIHENVQDMNVVDIDGDGVDEILLLTNKKLFIYRAVNNTFQKADIIELESHLRLHSVTWGDFDNDGHQELFISGNSGSRPSSMILKLEEGKPTIVRRKIPYYLRALSVPGKKAVLYGQVGDIFQPHGGAIYRLQWDSAFTFKRLEKIVVPKGVEIYDFIQADITGDSVRELIVITKNNRLQVRNSENEVMWTSADQFGAGRNFLGTLTSNEKQNIKVPAYIKSRLVITDIDMDGINDVVVGRNRVEQVRFIPRLRYFKGSSIMALSWKDNGLRPLWETGKLPGYIANYQVKNNESAVKQQFELLFTEAATNYFAGLWKAETVTINSYTFGLKNETGQ